MRSIAHISDLHFGAIDSGALEGLREDLREQHPDLIVISGDITQRARGGEFAQALRFIRTLTAPVLVVPGNHDLEPLSRPLRRIYDPLWLYRRFAAHIPPPQWQDDEIAVTGLDSTRHLRWQSGRLRLQHLHQLEAAFAPLSPDLCRIAFLHHPPAYMTPRSYPFTSLATHGLDLVLTGHGHRSKVGLVDNWQHHSCILVQAPSACSNRLRGEANGYAMIFIDMPTIAVEIRSWNGIKFRPQPAQCFYKVNNRWLGRPVPHHPEPPSSDQAA